MLSVKKRFHGHNSLRFVYNRGQTVRGPLFSIKYALNPRRDNYRAAVVISRKVNKSAVARNRVRRRLYEALRQLDSDIVEPYDIVISVFSDGLLDQPSQALANQLKKQLKAGGILAKRIKKL